MRKINLGQRHILKGAVLLMQYRSGKNQYCKLRTAQKLKSESFKAVIHRCFILSLALAKIFNHYPVVENHLERGR